MKQLVLIGSGGHAGVVLGSWHKDEGLKHYDILGCVDDLAAKGSYRHGLEVLGSATPQHVPQECCLLFGIGDNELRYKIWGRFPKEQRWASCVDIPSGLNGTQLGTGSYVGRGAICGHTVTIGKFSIVNTGVILEHDSSVGDFSHLAPGVVTGGRVKIGNHTLIGLGAVIRDGITIGDHCVIGMGSVVVKDVPSNTVCYGNPARPVQMNA